MLLYEKLEAIHAQCCCRPCSSSSRFLLSPLPPVPRLFGCCCSLLARAGLSYCSVLAAVREKLKDWERVECRTVAELGKGRWQKNTDDSSGSLALTVTAYTSLCLCCSGQMDPKSSNWEEEERRGKWLSGRVAKWTEPSVRKPSVFVEDFLLDPPLISMHVVRRAFRSRVLLHLWCLEAFAHTDSWNVSRKCMLTHSWFFIFTQ